MPREYPDYPIVGVGAIVVKDNDEILLVKRKFEPSKGKWSIPGGLVEVGEKLEDAVLRELEEETGIKGQVVRPIVICEYIEKDSLGKVKYHFVIIDFLVKPLNLDLRVGSDVEDVKFFNINYALSKLELSQITRKLLERMCRLGVNRYLESTILDFIPSV